MRFSWSVMPDVVITFLVGVGVIVFRRQLARASNDFYASRNWQFMVFDEEKSSRAAFASGVLMLIVSVAYLVSGFHSS